MTKYIIIGAASLIVLVLLCALFMYRGKIFVKHGTRYTNDSKTEKDGEMNITYNTADILLKVGKAYKVGKKEKIIPGKYKVLSADGMAEEFNIRIHDVVRGYKHDTDIVLAEGDVITAVSHNVILR